MKKTYRQPTIQIVKVQTNKMLAASEQVGFGNSYDGTSLIEAPEMFLDEE